MFLFFCATAPELGRSCIEEDTFRFHSSFLQVTIMTSIQDAFQPVQREPAAPGFPHAPPDWTRARAEQIAQQEHLILGDDHWAVVRGLQEFFARHEDRAINLRDLHDALEEKFHHKGGVKYLYTLLPGGPIAQGCRLAGLEPPAGAVDRGFGSVA